VRYTGSVTSRRPAVLAIVLCLAAGAVLAAQIYKQGIDLVVV